MRTLCTIGAVILMLTACGGPTSAPEEELRAWVAAGVEAATDKDRRELVNMISGNAKAEFQLKSVSISCPTVVVGAHHRVSPPPGAACVSIPCATDCGQVSLEISICESSNEESGTENIAA